MMILIHGARIPDVGAARRRDNNPFPKPDENDALSAK